MQLYVKLRNLQRTKSYLESVHITKKTLYRYIISICIYSEFVLFLIFEQNKQQTAHYEINIKSFINKYKIYKLTVIDLSNILVFTSIF